MKTLLRFTAFGVSLLVTLGTACLYLSVGQRELARNLENKALDLRFRWRGVRSPGSQVVLVAIDDASIAALGRWPWSRSRFAELVRRLNNAGARVIAFDLLFTEPETNAARDAFQTVQEAFEALELPERDARMETFHRTLISLAEAAGPDHDFARALQEAGNVVLAYTFQFTRTAASRDAAVSPESPPASTTPRAYRAFQYATPEAAALLPHAIDILPPIAVLGRQTQTLGHANASLDTDGVLRYDFLAVAFKEAYYASLPVQVARLYLGLALEEVKVQFGRGLQLGPHFIPTDETMSLLVNYYGPQGSFPTYSVADVLQGRLSDALFRDKIVLIGGMAVGLGDTFTTPFSPELHGLEKHATVIANILRGTFLQRHEGMVLLDCINLALLGVLVGWFSPKLSLLSSWLWAIGLGVSYVVLNYLAFARLGLWVNLVFPLTAVVLTQVAITIHRALTEERQKRRIRRAFQYYLHPSVVERVTLNPQLLTLGGEKKELTVLFTDIRGFTSIAERLTPEVLVQLLNEYLSAMTQLVLDEDGLLDKYIGDALMAVYGAPIAMPDHAYRACRTALRMFERLETLQRYWHERGLPQIDIGIGINTGPMVVGNMGSDLRFNYTVMGDAVNLGARLEEANKAYGTHIIVSEATREQVKDSMASRELDAVRVKGKATPVRIFEVIGFLPLAREQSSLIQHFEQGLQAYRAQQWDTAMQCFRLALEQKPDDQPSHLYLHRCVAFKHTPPLPDWDGVYVMRTKSS